MGIETMIPCTNCGRLFIPNPGDQSGFHSVECRFWHKVNLVVPIPSRYPELGPCFGWTACCNKDGYGEFDVDGKVVLAHRWVWEFVHGPLPSGRQINHLCGNLKCVRSDHLVDGDEAKESFFPKEDPKRIQMLTEGIRLKNEGMALAADCKHTFIEIARMFAIDIAKRNVNHEVDMDQVQLMMDSHGLYDVLGAAAGSVFKEQCWVFTGKRVMSCRRKNHARELKIWQYNGS